MSGGRFHDISQLQDRFNQYQHEERISNELLAERWNKLKTDIENGQNKLNNYINALNEISCGAKDQPKGTDNNRFSERVRISLAGSFYEVKRGALVQDPAIGWNRLSCLFKKRWEKFLLCDKNGRIYFDYESEWMKPILQALKGEVDIVLNKSSNNVSAWNIILSRFQLQENIKFNLTKENDLISSQKIQFGGFGHPYNIDSAPKVQKIDTKPVTVSRTPITLSKKSVSPFGLVHSSGSAFLESSEALQKQLALLNQSAQLLFQLEEVHDAVQVRLMLFLKELKFIREFLYSEWKDIILSLPTFDIIEEKDESNIEKHIQYFATIFPLIQEYKDRVKSASSEAEKRQLDGLAYFNVEGERMVIKKSSVVSVFGESQLAVRLSGRWTEQADDVDEEGNIYYDVSSSAAFRSLLQCARFRSFRVKGPLTFPNILQIPLQSLLDYFSIDMSSVSILYADK
eukprot:gene15494-17350_t